MEVHLHSTNVAPLHVRSKVDPMMYSLQPVPLRRTCSPAAFADAHAMPGGRVVDLHPDDAFRVAKYLERNRAVALTSDGMTLFALREGVLIECALSAHALAQHTIDAQFIPMDWVGGQAVPSGAPERIDITRAVMEMPLATLQQLTDGSPEANALVDPEDRAHYGPHQVVCVAAITHYFGCDLASITGEMQASATPRRPASLVVDDTDQEPLWMLNIASRPARSFSCRAADIMEAIRKAGEMFPGHPVSGAFSIA
jgi:hypothetical protein